MHRVTSRILRLVLVLKKVANPATNLAKVEEKEKILPGMTPVRRRKTQTQTPAKNKRKANDARSSYLSAKMDEIENCVKEGNFSRSLLEEFMTACTTPYKHTTTDGYVTYTTGKDVSCVSTMALRAVDNVLADRQKAEEISSLQAKRRKMGNGKKKCGVPNTRLSADGIEAEARLLLDKDFVHDEEKTKAVKALERKRLQEKEAHKNLLF